MGIPLETGQKQYSVDYKLETYLKIARLYLEDEDPVQGEAYINRAAILLTQTNHATSNSRECPLRKCGALLQHWHSPEDRRSLQRAHHASQLWMLLAQGYRFLPSQSPEQQIYKKIQYFINVWTHV